MSDPITTYLPDSQYQHLVVRITERIVPMSAFRNPAEYEGIARTVIEGVIKMLVEIGIKPEAASTFAK